MSTLTHAGYGIEFFTLSPLDELVSSLKEAFQMEGFGVLCEIDVEATMKAKLGVDIGTYKIFGLCNPHLAANGIEMEPNIGLLLPCNVLVRREGEGFLVAAQDPETIMDVVKNRKLVTISEEARCKIDRAMDALQDSLA